ncbi:MAG TPA: aldolase/citrate lyase family protein [Burkholderiales bacterium]|nr:aldolase/citrate lyase family protein [Burkholderiales bacterium]
MSVVPNHALRQLRAGKLAIGLGLRQARTVDTAQILKTAGFDWMFIDCEHSSIGTDTAAQISSAALAVGVTPVVRVPGKEEHWLISRMLDNGAQGVVVPHVDTAEEAKRIADFCRFPPVGHRSMGGGLQQIGFAPMPIGEVARVVNEETLVVVMLESPQAIASCEAIAAVKGIDALLIGTNDLCFEMGIPGQFNDPRVKEAYAKTIAACRKHGKFAGMGGMYTAELLERHIAMGVQLILSGSDFSLLLQGATARAQLVRGFEGKSAGKAGGA